MLLLSAECVVSLKFLPFDGEPYCQSFNTCFTKTIPYFRFLDRLYNEPISLAEFQGSHGVSVDMDLNACKSFTSSDNFTTYIANDLAFNISVHLFHEKNILVLGEQCGEATVKLSRELQVCGTSRFPVKPGDDAGLKQELRKDNIKPELLAEYDKEHNFFIESLKGVIKKFKPRGSDKPSLY
jgi:hypothetical protein